MKAVSLLSLILALLVVITSPLLAQDGKGKKKRNANAATARQLKDVEDKLSSLDLTDEQKRKVDDLLASYKQKFADVQGKAPKLSKEQRQTQKEVTEKAKAEGKKGKQLQAEIAAALNLTDEQKKQREEAGAERKRLLASLKKDLAEVLTPEQAKVLKRGTKNEKQ
jgi:Spy/CpxP family protein refolding chaperone